jgi:hypothetical protein
MLELRKRNLGLDCAWAVNVVVQLEPVPGPNNDVEYYRVEDLSLYVMSHHHLCKIYSVANVRFACKLRVGDVVAPI